MVVHRVVGDIPMCSQMQCYHCDRHSIYKITDTISFLAFLLNRSRRPLLYYELFVIRMMKGHAGKD